MDRLVSKHLKWHVIWLDDVQLKHLGLASSIKRLEVEDEDVSIGIYIEAQLLDRRDLP